MPIVEQPSRCELSSRTTSRDERIRHFDTEIYHRVEGWLGDRMSQIIGILGTALDQNGVRGDIVEFGVHHGLFLFLLNALCNNTEKCYAVDVFEQQQLNIDRSGNGSLSAFTSNLEELLPLERQFFEIIQRDTLSFSLNEISLLFGANNIKFFSIDASHTLKHVFNDLCLAQEVVSPGGIVAIDDFMSSHWPEVNEGFYEFMKQANRRFKPFLCFQNKLFLTTVAEHDSLLNGLRNAINDRFADDIRAGRWKEVLIAGGVTLSLA